MKTIAEDGSWPGWSTSTTMEIASVSMRDLVIDFESLGDNCELGIVQRTFGAEPLGLLRWVGINHVDMLIRALDGHFDGLGDIDNIGHEILAGWDHHAAIDRKYGFYFHTDLDPSKVLDQPDEMQKIAQQEARRLRFLADNLMKVLRSGEKILVYRQKKPLQPTQIDALFGAVRRLGPNTLLVVAEDQDREPGTVEVRPDGLLLGFVKRLSNENPPQIDVPAWERILVSAHDVWLRARAGADSTKLYQVPLRGIFDRGLTAAPDGLLASFESLGRGSEFGIAQSFVGIEPPGLFRFSTVSHDALMTLLANRFEDIADAASLSVVVRDGAYVARLDSYDVEYRTGIPAGQGSDAEIIDRERVRLRSHTARLLEDLASGEKIFIRFDPQARLADIRELHAALKRYGPNKLLWVDQATSQSEAGTAELLESGLVRGRVLRRSETAMPTPHALALWLKVALDARDHLSRAENVGTLWERGAWVVPKEAATMLSAEVDGAPFGHPVFKHVFNVATTDENANILMHDIRFDMKPNAIYTISAWVRIPGDFSGSQVAMVAVGFPSIHGWAARMSRRDEWQHLVTSFRQPMGQVAAAPGLRAIGRAGDCLYTTGWRLDEGAVPTAYFF